LDPIPEEALVLTARPLFITVWIAFCLQGIAKMPAGANAGADADEIREMQKQLTMRRKKTIKGEFKNI
jgi:hypothetical protein